MVCQAEFSIKVFVFYAAVMHPNKRARNQAAHSTPSSVTTFVPNTCISAWAGGIYAIASEFVLLSAECISAYAFIHTTHR